MSVPDCRRGRKAYTDCGRRVSHPHLMKILDLADVAALSRVGHGVGGDPLHVHLAGFRIHFDPARNRVAERLRLGLPVLRQVLDRGAERLSTSVRSFAVYLTGGENMNDYVNRL